MVRPGEGENVIFFTTPTTNPAHRVIIQGATDEDELYFYLDGFDAIVSYTFTTVSRELLNVKPSADLDEIIVIYADEGSVNRLFVCD